MSSYRDDYHDITAIADAVQSTIKVRLDDYVSIDQSSPVGVVSVLLLDQLATSDSALDQLIVQSFDSVGAGDSTQGQLLAMQIIENHLSALDSATFGLSTFLVDSISASDSEFFSLLSFLQDSLSVSDAHQGVRLARAYIQDDSLTASDGVTRISKEFAQDTISPQDQSTSVAATSAQLSDAAAVSEAWQFFGKARSFLSDTSLLDSTAQGHALAVQSTSDDAMLTSDVSDGFGGQTWTAASGLWAISRHYPSRFESLSVIDGNLYGFNEDGVYRLGTSQPVTGVIKTAKIDLSGGVLVHPLTAFLEYQLDGSAEMHVSSTQNGATVETYTYQLPQESSDTLTNGRFVFGKGLRGRHFGFELRLSGSGGYVNDLVIQFVPTGRRV